MRDEEWTWDQIFSEILVYNGSLFSIHLALLTFVVVVKLGVWFNEVQF